MKKRSISFILVLLLMFTAIPTYALAENSTPDKAGTLARTYLTELSDKIGQRIAGTEGEVKGGAFVADSLKAMGYTVTVQKFSFKDKEKKAYDSSNIIAVKQGTSKKEIIVGAHYDSKNIGKGADDNGSAVAVLLETAKYVKELNTPYTIKFIAFGAEETGLNGSKYFVSKMTKKEIANTLLMINMDSLIAGDNMYVYGDYGKGGLVRDYVLKNARLLNLKVGTNMGENPDYPLGTTGDWSDHAPFMRAGIPYIYFEGTNWLLGAGDGYTQVDTKLGENGEIWHTQYDTIKYLDETFKGRVDEHLNAYVTLLEKVITEYKFAEKK